MQIMGIGTVLPNVFIFWVGGFDRPDFILFVLVAPSQDADRELNCEGVDAALIDVSSAKKCFHSDTERTSMAFLSLRAWRSREEDQENEENM